ncbi:hypothetical protein [Ruegeria sp. ANG-S4]|uniref:hypothetical protein n=1 Tax=Ruegeria sp. ANG-S4 TaxID=1577904 RepID=UPI00126A63A5|nr:hypothetical protein [Ruegeria sp. ANG-S4]
MSFTRVSGFTKFMAFPTGIIGSDDPITIADILSTRSIGNIGLEAATHCGLHVWLVAAPS